MNEIETYPEGADHLHCPCGCEKPQPFFEDGKWWCMRCAVGRGCDKPSRCEMIPCTPGVCADGD